MNYNFLFDESLEYLRERYSLPKLEFSSFNRQEQKEELREAIKYVGVMHRVRKLSRVHNFDNYRCRTTRSKELLDRHDMPIELLYSGGVYEINNL